MQTSKKERSDVTEAQAAKSRVRQLEILSWWIKNRCEEVGGEIVEGPNTECCSLIRVPNTPETHNKVQQIAGMMSLFDEILTQDLENTSEKDPETSQDQSRRDTTETETESTSNNQGLEPLFGDSGCSSTTTDQTDQTLDPLFGNSSGETQNGGVDE